MTASLTDLAGFPVELQVVIEPSLLSGAVIQIGDLQVDATSQVGVIQFEQGRPHPMGSFLDRAGRDHQ